MGQPNWVPLSQPAFTPGFEFYNFSVEQNIDGRLEAFLLGKNGVLGHCWQLAPGKDWSEWLSQGQPPNNTFPAFPRAKRNADGRLEVFISGSDYTPWHIWQLAPGKNDWSSWSSLGQPVGIDLLTIDVGQNLDGRLEVFSAGSKDQASSTVPVDLALWHRWQLAPNGGWSEWASLGTAPNAIYFFSHVARNNADGRLEVFVSGPDYRPWHTWQLAPGKNDWSTWSSLGQPSGVNMGIPVVVSNVDGRLEVFDVGSDGALWHTWQLVPNGAWSEWAFLGSTPLVPGGPTEPVVGTNKDGRLEIFVTDASAVLWHSLQLTPKGSWSEWASLGKPSDLQPDPDTGVIPTPVIVENADGRLEVFLPGQTTCWHIWQLSPGGPWSS